MFPFEGNTASARRDVKKARDLSLTLICRDKSPPYGNQQIKRILSVAQAFHACRTKSFMQKNKNYTETLPSELSFEMIYIKEGSFMMGNDDNKAYDWEKPVHKVTVPSFYLGKYLLTQVLWEAVMGNNPSRFKGENRPVEQVSWEDTQIFIQKLNEMTGRTYRLPTEAEWEFAARGGIHTEEYRYAGSDKLKEVGWYEENSSGQTHPVGQKLGNELSLYDMSGNVWEWVEDQWHSDYTGAPKDGSAWLNADKGASRVLSGGSWIRSARRCRVSDRLNASPGDRGGDIGFRLVLSLQSA